MPVRALPVKRDVKKITLWVPDRCDILGGSSTTMDVSLHHSVRSGYSKREKILKVVKQ